jgi:hypothetical protein
VWTTKGCWHVECWLNPGRDADWEPFVCQSQLGQYAWGNLCNDWLAKLGRALPLSADRDRIGYSATVWTATSMPTWTALECHANCPRLPAENFGVRSMQADVCWLGYWTPPTSIVPWPKGRASWCSTAAIRVCLWPRQRLNDWSMRTHDLSRDSAIPLPSQNSWPTATHTKVNRRWARQV